MSSLETTPDKQTKKPTVEQSQRVEETTTAFRNNKTYVNDAFDEAYAAINSKRAAKENSEAPRQPDSSLIRLESIDQGASSSAEVSNEERSSGQNSKLKQRIYALDELIATEKDFLAEMSICYEAFMGDKSDVVRFFFVCIKKKKCPLELKNNYLTLFDK
jgi:hypothetical protein